MLSKEDVEWAYRVVLNREPEDDACIQEKRSACPNMKILRDTLLASDEYVRDSGGTPGKSNIVIKPIGNLRLYVDITDRVVGMALIHDNYETEELKFVRSTVKPGWNVLDLGANYGIYTLTMAAIVGVEGSVVAFEPLSPIRELLMKTVRENRLTNVEVRSEAAGLAAAKVKLVHAPVTINRGGAFLTSLEAEPRANHVADIVTMIPVGMLNLKRPIGFIKMDIEGSEGMAVQGMENILAEDHPIVMCELHDPQLRSVSGTTAPGLVQRFADMGYSCKAFIPGGLVPVSGSELAGRVTNVVFFPR